MIKSSWRGMWGKGRKVLIIWNILPRSNFIILSTDIYPKTRANDGSNDMRYIFLLLIQAAQIEF